MRRALIFDFDGTMLDTEWPAFQAWLAIFQRHGATLALQDWVACVGSDTGFLVAFRVSGTSETGCPSRHRPCAHVGDSYRGDSTRDEGHYDYETASTPTAWSIWAPLSPAWP